MMCKSCNKREINQKRSTVRCDRCLDARLISNTKSYHKKKDEDSLSYKNLLLRIRKNQTNRKSALLLDELCVVCGKNTIDTTRSKKRCLFCLNKDALRLKVFRSDPNNKKKIQCRQRKWELNNPEKHKEQKHRTYINNKDDYYRYARERIARKKDVGGSFTLQEWNVVLSSYGNSCLWCGTDSRIEADHVVPLVHKGKNIIQNIQPLCRTCNSKKGSKIIDFRPYGNWILDWT